MKKSILLVVLFLMGMTTQTFSQQNKNVANYPGTYDRYYNSHEIRFVENGVLYSVATDGTFHFRELHDPYAYRNGRRNYKTMYYNSVPGQVTYVNSRRGNRNLIRTDRLGRIRSIGSTQITYKRNGKVRSIGSVTMTYNRGLLTSVGNLIVHYNRRGKIRKTTGYVNRYNRKFWHDSWYRHNNDWDGDDWDDGWDDDWGHDRNRKRKKD
ncbi:MAG: hypothetical protein DWP94_04555 [Flavobacterium sp.]|nr:MAG: hypothetical protein DWP94_04555 [Flavobacterium sp.]